LRENLARYLEVAKQHDRHSRLIGNWHVDPIRDRGESTLLEGNVAVESGWTDFPFASLAGHDHSSTAETAAPKLG
jgi:hypothetical protein